MKIQFEGKIIDTLDKISLYKTIENILTTSNNIVDIFQNNCQLLSTIAQEDDYGLMLLLLDYYEKNVLNKIIDDQSPEFVEAVNKLTLEVHQAFHSQPTISEEMFKVVEQFFEDKSAERINQLYELSEEVLGPGFDEKNPDLLQQIFNFAVEQNDINQLKKIICFHKKYFGSDDDLQNNLKEAFKIAPGISIEMKELLANHSLDLKIILPQMFSGNSSNENILENFADVFGHFGIDDKDEQNWSIQNLGLATISCNTVSLESIALRRSTSDQTDRSGSSYDSPLSSPDRTHKADQSAYFQSSFSPKKISDYFISGCSGTNFTSSPFSDSPKTLGTSSSDTDFFGFQMD